MRNRLGRAATESGGRASRLIPRLGAVRAGGGRESAASDDRQRLLRRLLDSGVFDPEFYAASAGYEFAGPRAAAHHCLDVGMPQGLSPNPLLSVLAMPGGVQRAWRRGRIGKVLDFLRDPDNWDRPISPLFHPATYAAQVGFEPGHGTPLAHFVHTAAPTTLLPVPPGSPPVTYEAGRTALMEAATATATQARQAPGHEPDLLDSGDPAWRSRFRAVALPHTAPAPLVSILTPTSLGADRLSALLEQLIGQSLTTWEWLLAASPGDDISAAEQIAALDPRVRVLPPVERAPNGIPALDWQTSGLRAARGSYVVYLNTDHRWREDFLQVAIAALQASGRPVGHAAVTLHDPDDQEAVMRAGGEVTQLRAGGWVDVGVMVCSATELRAIGGPDAAFGDGFEADLALRLAERTPLLPLPFIGSDRQVDRLPSAPFVVDAEGDWLAAVARSWVDWDRVRAAVGQRVTGRVSVVVPTLGDSSMTITAVRTLLASTSLTDVEVVIIDNGSEFAVSQDLTAAFLTDPRVHHRRLPVNLNFAIACDVGLAESTGSTVVFLNNDTRSYSDWLPAVLRHLEDPSVAGAQPLLLYPRGVIQTAGTVFPTANGLPCHFLSGQPPEAAEAVRGLQFSAATAAALAMRASDLAFLEGFDPHYVNGTEDVDLCLRALPLRPGGFRVEPSSRVVHLEGKTPGRNRRIPANRAFFMRRWHGLLPGPETDLYAAAGFAVVDVESDDQDIPSPRPVLDTLPADRR